MTAIRRLAVRLVTVAGRLTPTHDADWGRAMRRELDFIENDWAALLWALGSATTLLRDSVTVRSLGKNTAGLISGIAIAGGVLAASWSGLEGLVLLLFPRWRTVPVPVADWLTVVAVPEAIFVVAVIALWHRRRPMAAGILLTAFTLMLHFVVHVTA